VSRATVVSRRRCQLCKRLFTLRALAVIEWQWDRDLVQEQLLCMECVWSIPQEVLDDVPHVWRWVG
jgi:hypothetical protein